VHNNGRDTSYSGCRSAHLSLHGSNQIPMYVIDVSKHTVTEFFKGQGQAGCSSRGFTSGQAQKDKWKLREQRAPRFLFKAPSLFLGMMLLLVPNSLRLLWKQKPSICFDPLVRYEAQHTQIRARTHAYTHVHMHMHTHIHILT